MKYWIGLRVYYFAQVYLYIVHDNIINFDNWYSVQHIKFIFITLKTYERMQFFESSQIPSLPQHQRYWNSFNIKRIIESKLNFNNIMDQSRFFTLNKPESGAWLHTIPYHKIGTFIDFDMVY